VASSLVPPTCSRPGQAGPAPSLLFSQQRRWFGLRPHLPCVRCGSGATFFGSSGRSLILLVQLVRSPVDCAVPPAGVASPRKLPSPNVRCWAAIHSVRQWEEVPSVDAWKRAQGMVLVSETHRGAQRLHLICSDAQRPGRQGSMSYAMECCALSPSALVMSGTRPEPSQKQALLTSYCGRISQRPKENGQGSQRN